MLLRQPVDETRDAIHLVGIEVMHEELQVQVRDVPIDGHEGAAQFRMERVRGGLDRHGDAQAVRVGATDLAAELELPGGGQNASFLVGLHPAALVEHAVGRGGRNPGQNGHVADRRLKPHGPAS